MDIARIMGMIVATRKDPQLAGCALFLIQPLNADLQPEGEPLVATDCENRFGTGEIIYFVASGDAVPTGPGGSRIPVDAAIVGQVDHLDHKKEYLD